ncbi:MAG: hypothetical protein KTR15_09700 [Phycisphaeraceae bacterium]|nr:hypothetical protein [Phycisphaeraceae bacterium]
MKPIFSMLFVLAAALLLSSPAHAGYADGMNQYAGYHVIRGVVDPTGTMAANVQSKIEWTWTKSTDDTKEEITIVTKDGEQTTNVRSVGKASLRGVTIVPKCKIDYSCDCGRKAIYDSVDIVVDFRLFLLDPRHPGNGKWPADGGGWKKVAYHEYLHTQQAIEKIEELVGDADEPDHYEGKCIRYNDMYRHGRPGVEDPNKTDEGMLKKCERIMLQRISQEISTSKLIKAGRKAFHHDKDIYDEHDNWQDAWDNNTFPQPSPPVVQPGQDPTTWPGASP